MNYFAIPSIITCIASFLFGLLVLLKDIRSRVNITFSLLCFSCSLWLFCYSFMYLSGNSSSALMWARFGFLGIALIPIFAYQFITTFLNIAPRRLMLLLLGLTTIASFLLSRTNYIYNGVEKYFWGFYPTAGILYFIFLAMFIVLIGYGTILLFLSWRTAIKENAGSRINQIFYVFLAFAGSATGLVDYIVKYKISVYPWASFSVLFFIVTITYAITRHRLLDIEVVIKKTAVYSILTALLTGIFISFIFLAQQLFSGLLGHSSLWAGLVAAFVIAMVFQPLRDAIQRLVDRLFFKGKYDYRNTLKSLSHSSATIIDLDQLISSTSANVSEALKPEKVSFYLWDKEKGFFRLKSS